LSRSDENPTAREQQRDDDCGKDGARHVSILAGRVFGRCRYHLSTRA
jgi:hypothetical protein